MGRPVVAGPPAESPGRGIPPLGELSCVASSAVGDLPHTPATAEEASATAPAIVSHPVPARTKTSAAHRFLPATNSLNRVCLEDRPGATISFTGHDAQPKTGTTPAPPKATVNDDHPPQQVVLKRYKPVNGRKVALSDRRWNLPHVPPPVSEDRNADLPPWTASTPG